MSGALDGQVTNVPKVSHGAPVDLFKSACYSWTTFLLRPIV